ncbi:MAG TPA: isocitrate lyase/phosphoenolpyruvate mutase family protein [Gemmatimonadales bacterium]|nr:isocitrate lyase/phosphoenolpyruvate mutase family protein [Gemmatimonadales bacterium]
MTDLRSKADLLRALHRGPRILVLPNAWDAASARLFAAAGFPALATTSAGVAFSEGYADGERIPREKMLARVATVAAAVSVPVTADVEAGYGDAPEAAGETARGVLAAGAVGMNLEDWSERSGRLFDLAAQVERIRTVRAAAGAAGVPLVLNARTDSFSAGAALPPERRLAEAVQRGNAYRDAGADSVFVPFVSDAPTIERLAREIHAPLNILGGPGAPPVKELERLGVRRVTIGSAAMRATLGLVRRIAGELSTEGTFTALADGIPFAEMQKIFGGD